MIYLYINKNILKLFCVMVLLSLFCWQELSAQVRLGGVTSPSHGALLDLNKDDGTSIKGLMLPRVKLMSLDNLNDIIPDNTSRPDPLVHIGLTVYAVANDENCSTITPGIFVWSSIKWERLGQELTELEYLIQLSPSNLEYNMDQDGNTFVANSFGDAGVWMIHNLAVTKFADGTPIGVFVTESVVPAYTYPNALPGNWGQQPASYYPQQGFLYNWYAATNSYASVVDQQQATPLGSAPGINEVERTGTGGTAPAMYVQGVCPNGWHIPSDREWTQLAKELYTNPEAYSNYIASEIPVGTTWDSAWELLESGETATADEDNPLAFGAGNIAKDMCKIQRANSSMHATEGKSDKLKNGGFNIALDGFMVNGFVANFGWEGYVWSSSTDANYAYFRSFSESASGINKNFTDKLDFMSVRCKKN